MRCYAAAAHFHEFITPPCFIRWFLPAAMPAISMLLPTVVAAMPCRLRHAIDATL